jgi:hypothetical protein
MTAIPSCFVSLNMAEKLLRKGRVKSIWPSPPSCPTGKGVISPDKAKHFGDFA